MNFQIERVNDTRVVLNTNHTLCTVIFFDYGKLSSIISPFNKKLMQLCSNLKVIIKHVCMQLKDQRHLSNEQQIVYNELSKINLETDLTVTNFDYTVSDISFQNPMFDWEKLQPLINSVNSRNTKQIALSFVELQLPISIHFSDIDKIRIARMMKDEDVVFLINKVSTDLRITQSELLTALIDGHRKGFKNFYLLYKVFKHFHIEQMYLELFKISRYDLLEACYEYHELYDTFYVHDGVKYSQYNCLDYIVHNLETITSKYHFRMDDYVTDTKSLIEFLIILFGACKLVHLDKKVPSTFKGLSFIVNNLNINHIFLHEW